MLFGLIVSLTILSFAEQRSLAGIKSLTDTQRITLRTELTDIKDAVNAIHNVTAINAITNITNLKTYLDGLTTDIRDALKDICLTLINY